MSFECSLGDFVALGQLTWKVYKACEDAPDQELSQEVLSLQVVLEEIEETYLDVSMSTAQKHRLGVVGD